MEKNQINCDVHKREKIMYCNKDKIWFCDFCMKDHKMCGFPIHYSEVLENYIQSGKNDLASNLQDVIVNAIDKLSRSKSEIIEIIDNYIIKLKESMNLQIDLNKENKIEIAYLINKITNLNKENQEEMNCSKFIKSIKESVLKLEKNICPEALQNTNNLLTPNYLLLMRKWLKNDLMNVELVYKASVHGFKIDKFYSMCSSISNNIVVIKTKYGKIIGGFTPLPWRKGSHDYEYFNEPDQSTFIFSFTLEKKYPLKNFNYAICYSHLWGPKFGGGHDLEIIDECNVHASLYNGIGHTFDFQGEKIDFYGSNDKYLIEDWEFYKVI